MVFIWRWAGAPPSICSSAAMVRTPGVGNRVSAALASPSSTGASVEVARSTLAA